MIFSNTKKVFCNYKFMNPIMKFGMYFNNKSLHNKSSNFKNPDPFYSTCIHKGLRNFKSAKSPFDIGLHSYKNKMQKVSLNSKRFIIYSDTAIKKSLNNIKTAKSPAAHPSLKPYMYKLQDTLARARVFIFYDQSGKRWRNIKVSLIVLSALIILMTAAFAFGLQVSPILPANDSNQKTGSYLPINKPITNNSASKAYAPPQSNSNSSLLTGKLNVYGYIDNNDNYLTSNVSDYIDAVNVLIPQWYELSCNNTFEVSIDENIESYSKGKNVPIMPSISNVYGSEANSDLLQQMLDSEEKRKELINALLSDVKTKKYAGININFQGLDFEHKDVFTSFISELYKAFHSEGLDVTVMLPPDDEAYDYNSLSKNADMIILMLYKNNLVTSDSIAPLSWCSKIIDDIPVPSDKLAVMFSNYSYDWINDSSQSVSIGSYWDAMDTAKNSNAQIFWDSENYEPYFRYSEGNKEHTVRFLDGVTFYNQLKVSLQSNVRNITIPLGTVDPTIWETLLKIHGTPDVIFKNMQKIDCLESLVVKGKGEIMDIAAISQAGKRSIQFTDGGFINSEKYDSYPIPSLIVKSGYKEAKEVVLTFDDGPSPLYTPRILDILKENNVKATFFMIGKNVALHPSIVQRVYMEGHEIGNHTFSHINMGEISSLRLKFEINSTQRLIQQITGHSTVLFRPPYTTTFQISRPEVKSLYNVQHMGYTLFGSYIDSTDWNENNSDNIVNNVMQDLKLGNIILLHDAGGNRSQTVKALPEIIKKLKENGYTFTTISQLENKTSGVLMPAVQKSEVRYMYTTRVFTTFTMFLLELLKFIILSSLILGILRLALFIFIISKKQSTSAISSEIQNYNPYVSVIIPAFNEENVIYKTVDCILKSDYQNLEIIIVDDGSTDKTAEIVTKRFHNKMKVKLICKDNGGKASSLNLGIKRAKGQIIVALDADTVIMPNAISLMVRHFTDKNVGAVSGNIKVGNVCNLLTRCQYIEYVTGINLEKRCFGKLNCITVVPGAIGAWRKDALITAGGFVDDTLAEDTDVTLGLLEHGYKITLEDKALGFTEAPQNLKSFIKQRHRWSYGTLQCIWKHRHYIFSFKNKALSLIALPNMILFQYIFQILAPLIDVLFIFGLFISPEKVITYYLLVLCLDMFSAYYAFSLGNEKKSLIFWTIIQKFIYRWYMSYIVSKSFITACRGIIVGWNKLIRIGNVKSVSE